MKKDQKPKEEILEGEILEEEMEVEMLATPDDIKEAVDYLKMPYKSLFNVSLIDLAIFTALKLKEVEETCKKNTKK